MARSRKDRIADRADAAREYGNGLVVETERDRGVRVTLTFGHKLPVRH